mmetsp:Transcript_11649/g.16632  ORF Transcript_11649/g.16632 Transcript_11649/m.16632 type:complete len:88 (-) Transcript_11649:102-365(-)
MVETQEEDFHVRVKANQKDVDIQIQRDQSVGDVKQVVRSALGPSADGRYLRLISRGRLLAPDSATITDFSLKNGDVLHAVLAAAGVR